MNWDEVMCYLRAGVRDGRPLGQGGSKGKGRSRPRPPIDDRPRRAANQVKVRVEATAKHALGDVVAALREVADRLEEELAQEAA